MAKSLPKFYQIEKNKLNVYFESRSKKVLAGTLFHDDLKPEFKFVYDSRFIREKKAIAIGPDLNLSKKTHLSPELFSSLVDRIPSKENPAYKEYCESAGISPSERDPIILLATIGKRGPSSFIFEPVISLDLTSLLAETERFRSSTKISLRDFASFIGTTPTTLQRVYSQEAKADGYVIKSLALCFTYPEVAQWHLSQSSSQLHSSIVEKIQNYFFKKS